MEDARVAVETGVDGVNLLIGTSSQLMQHSHGKDMNYILRAVTEVVQYVKSMGVEVRFSGEDSFRTTLADLLGVYSLADRLGVDRVGVADTVGCAGPRQVYRLVSTLRAVVGCDIEVHLHNDTGCAVANAFCAIEAGATHVDTSVLGVGERNGITSLGGLMARMVVEDRASIAGKYWLDTLKDLELLVAEAVNVTVPFNNPITGFSAFTHKAGIHAKAVLNNPGTYEVLDPADFGLERNVHVASRLTGWNAIKARAIQLDVHMTDAQYKACTGKVKAMADVRQLSGNETDDITRAYLHSEQQDLLKQSMPMVGREIIA
ncbi:homocitrate synthase [Microdochium nivale]|nr:homocitrate synthase [Microdochium nivale]